MADPQHPHTDEVIHRTRTMALGVVASFAGGALLILGLGGSKVIAALVFVAGLVAGALAVRHGAPLARVPHQSHAPVSPAPRAPELRSVRRIPDGPRRAPVPMPEPESEPEPEPEPEREPEPEPERAAVEVASRGEDEEIDLTVAAPAVDAVVQALADLRGEASATEALLARLAERRPR